MVYCPACGVNNDVDKKLIETIKPDGYIEDGEGSVVGYNFTTITPLGVHVQITISSGQRMKPIKLLHCTVCGAKFPVIIGLHNLANI